MWPYLVIAALAVADLVLLVALLMACDERDGWHKEATRQTATADYLRRQLGRREWPKGA